MSSEDIDELSSLSDPLDVIFSRVLLCVVFSTFSSVCKLIPRNVCNLCVGRPPVRFPIDLAFLFVGLFWLAWLVVFSCRISFIGNPVPSSSLNIGR